MSDLKALYDAIVDGNAGKAKSITQTALDENVDPQDSKLKDQAETRLQFESLGRHLGDVRTWLDTGRKGGLKTRASFCGNDAGCRVASRPREDGTSNSHERSRRISKSRPVVNAARMA